MLYIHKWKCEGQEVKYIDSLVLESFVSTVTKYVDTLCSVVEGRHPNHPHQSQAAAFGHPSQTHQRHFLVLLGLVERPGATASEGHPTNQRVQQL